MYFDSTYTSAFIRSNSQAASRIDFNTKYGGFNNSYVSQGPDPEQQREEEIKPETEVPEVILTIVGKKQNERTSAQNSTVMKYLLKKGIFRFLVEKLSLEVVKNIIRQGNLKAYSGGQIFVCQGRRIKTVDILLFGHAYIISHLERTPEQEGIEEEEETGEIGQQFDRLVQKVGRETRKFKLKAQGGSRKGKGELEKSMLLSRKENLNISDDINLDMCEKAEGESFIDFEPLFGYEPKHTKTVAARELATVFSVPLEIFYEGLLHSYNSQLNQKLKLFRKVSVFDPFENSKLKTLIQRLEVTELKKHEFVYREGEEPSCFYLLIAGQVEISKTIDLFSENPNNLYKNRIQVSRERVNRQIKILPYANFNGVYNYTPEQKVISLAQVSPICIFGEEEVIEGKRRQVNARVLSLTAQLYQIGLESIEELCSKMIGANGQKKMTLPAFLAMMEENLTLKKILFRQNHLSDLVSYQNRSKYSTLFETKSSKRSRSYKQTKTQLQSTPEEGESRRSSRNSLKVQEEAPPQFNNFNFTDFLKDGNESIQPVSTQLNEEQARVVRLTHLKFSDNHQLKSKDKSIRLRSFSRELSARNKLTIDSFATIDSITNKITLDQPLFTVNYFEKQFRDEKKLYVQAKKKRLENIYKNSPQRLSRH